MKMTLRSFKITCMQSNVKGKLSHLSVIPDFNGADEITKSDQSYRDDSSCKERLTN